VLIENKHHKNLIFFEKIEVHNAIKKLKNLLKKRQIKNRFIEVAGVLK